jgi:hypothetical protein
MIEDLQIRIIDGKPTLYMWAPRGHTIIESFTKEGEKILTSQGINAAWIPVPILEMPENN